MGEEITESASEKNEILGKDLLSDYLRGFSSKGHPRNEERCHRGEPVWSSHRLTPQPSSSINKKPECDEQLQPPTSIQPIVSHAKDAGRCQDRVPKPGISLW